MLVSKNDCHSCLFAVSWCFYYSSHKTVFFTKISLTICKLPSTLMIKLNVRRAGKNGRSCITLFICCCAPPAAVSN